MSGVCQLTGETGKYVRSHLIPRALTKLSPAGEKMLEFGAGAERVILRPTSWYDNKLVTDKGERILAKYDTNGVSELTRLGIVWKSSRHESLVHENVNEQSGWGQVRLTTEFPEHLRMFFLSILWRSAASSMFEFADITLEKMELNYLRSLCLERKLRGGV
jgi:hypothetical protein